MGIIDGSGAISNALQELQNDITVPKNIKIKLEQINLTLNSSNELLIKVNKALDEFEDIVNDTNLKPYTRTQIWNIVSVLESYVGYKNQ